MNTKAVCALLLLAVAGAVAEEFNCAAEGRVCQNGGVCSEPTLSTTNPGSGGNGWSTPICVCKAPYGGPDCSWTIRECKDSPCQNGGTCAAATCSNTGMNSYDCFTCTCPAGWTGAPAYSSASVNPGGICDYPQPFDICSESSCANGGTCVPTTRTAAPTGGASWTCTCPTGFQNNLAAGIKNCTLPVFNCNTNSPCQNGGTCNVAGTSCTCPVGWQSGAGRTCSGARFCDANTCANGGTCTNTNGVNGGSCSCTANFEGPLCTIPKFCTVNTCQNGGTCFNANNNDGTGFCQCTSTAFGGNLCEVAPFCSSNPCQNGATCVPGTNGAGTCTNCPKGYAGQFCERALVGCGADKVGCAPGGSCPCTGQSNCGTLFDSTCSCSGNRYDCRCNSTFVSRCPGTSGTIQGRNVDMVCQNGGACAESAEKTVCSCRPGFWGENCENYDNPCLNSPCQNGGRCGITSETGQWWNAKSNSRQRTSYPLDDRFWGYECTCRWPYYGEHCELVAPRDPVVCTATSCQNGGTCGPTSYSVSAGNIRKTVGNFAAIAAPFSCACTANFTGVYCESAVTTCESYRAATNGPYCLNGAQCVNGRGNAAQSMPGCICPCGYAGDRCELMAANADATSLLTLSNSNGGVGYRLDFCSREPCQNGGTCQTFPNGQDFICMCKSGYGDRYCQTRVRSAAAGVVPSMVAVAAALAVAFALKH